MSLASIVMIAAILIACLVIAFYLIAVAWTLRRVSFNVGTVLFGIRAICRQVQPVPKYVGIILNDVMAIDQAAKQLLAWGGEPEDMVEDPRIARLTLELQSVDDEYEAAGHQPGGEGFRSRWANEHAEPRVHS